ncbi:MAG: IMP dehydrogenase [Candidatus Niyogibacteria bacterium]|nr:IMP dehydrogenase [Candidatus Niyogibacteria bacterium]
MANFKIKEGWSFDDVLLIPKRSFVFSRKDIAVETRFSKNIKLRTPIVSANMDTVTESKMARAMAELGGLGIIHRFLSIAEQAEEVRRVKRAENFIIDEPYTIESQKTIAEARKKMSQLDISGFLVVDAKNKLIGILTARDLMFDQGKNTLVSDIMTKKVITAAPKISIASAKNILRQHKIEKLPLVDKNGKIKGLITLKDLLKREKNPFATKDQKGRLMVGAALGIKSDMIERAEALANAGADALVVDVAHGHNMRVAETVKKLKKKFAGLDIIAGNIATYEGARDLINAGADAIKIGIGPGAACTTRIVTGVGVPQITAIMDAAKAAQKSITPIIADGGVKNSGDFAKALAAGADSVMIGSLFAGTDEAPGEYLMEDGVAYKFYRGMASYEAAEDKKNLDNAKDGFHRAPEGKSGRVPYHGYAKVVVADLIAGLRSSMSYLGAKNLKTFRQNAEFIKMTDAGFKESLPRNNK